MPRRSPRFALALALLASGCYDGGSLDALLAVDDEAEGSTTGEGTSGGEGASGDDEGTSAGVDDDVAPAIASFTVDGASQPAPIDAARAVTLAVEVVDPAAVSRVEIREGEALVASLGSPPFTASWWVDDVVASSPRALTAVAIGRAGEASAPAQVTVSFALPEGGTPRWMADGEVDVAEAEVLGVAIAADGDVVTVAERRIDPVTSQLVLVRRGAGDGAILWEARSPATPVAGERVVGRALAIDEGGQIVVGGAKIVDGEARLYVARHGEDGALVDAHVGAFGESIRDVAVVPGGDVVAVGSAGAAALDELGGELLLRRYGAGWTTRWSASPDDVLEEAWSLGHSVEVASDGSAVVAGTYGAVDASPRVFVARFAHDGAPGWVHVDAPPGLVDDQAAGLTLNRRGEVAVVATARVVGDPRTRVEIRRLRALDGALLSVDALGGGAGDESAGGVAVDRHDRLHVVVTRVDGEGQRSAGIVRLSSDGGAVLWAQTHAGSGGGEALGAAIAVDGLGYVYVGGASSTASSSLGWAGAFHP